MLKTVSKNTSALIKEKLIDTNIVALPITDETIHIIFDWFDEEEITLANAEADGECIDQNYFDNICLAVDELFENDEEKVDINWLNDYLAKM